MQLSRNLSICSFLALVLVITGSDYAVFVAGSSDQKDKKQDRRVHEYGFYDGTITAKGETWLELAAGWKGGRESVNNEEPKPVRISTKNTFLGGDLNGDGSKFTHLLADLMLGDRVLVDVRFNKQGDEWVHELKIIRRPGGKIPPMYGFAGECEIHLRYQAEQDWEEKGTPIPKQYLNKDGRYLWTNPPYPPVAPMPREVER